MAGVIDKNKYWDRRYLKGDHSGYGSYGEQLAKKLKWLSPLNFETVTEVGCGDFNFGHNLLLRHPAQYIGVDTSEVVLERNRRLYPEHIWLNLTQNFPPADLLLCVDVLYHIIDDTEYSSMLAALEASWKKYLVITAYEREQTEGLAPHVRIRNFNYKRFGAPIIREVVEEDGQLYFYVYERR